MIQHYSHTYNVPSYPEHIAEVKSILQDTGVCEAIIEPGDATRYEVTVFHYHSTLYMEDMYRLCYKYWTVVGTNIFEPWMFPVDMNRHTVAVLCNYMNSVIGLYCVPPLAGTGYQSKTPT